MSRSLGQSLTLRLACRPMWKDANWAPMAKSRLPKRTEQPAAAEDVRLKPLPTPRRAELPAQVAEDVRLMPPAQEPPPQEDRPPRPLAAQVLDHQENQDHQVEAQTANNEKSADIETRATTQRTLTTGATST